MLLKLWSKEKSTIEVVNVKTMVGVAVPHQQLSPGISALVRLQLQQEHFVLPQGANNDVP